MATSIRFLALHSGILLLSALWALSVSANPGFDDGGGAGLPACASCHADLANFGPDHGTHSALANNACNSCHTNGNDNPPLDNCVRCHGRDLDAGGDNISPGLGRGLRQHHVTVGAAACGNCHGDVTGPAGVGEHILPSFYPQALGGAGLNSCDGSEEQFPSNSVSLDNDGDGLTDAADPDCGPANTPPVANAGADQTVNVGDTVVLNGGGSSDADGDLLTYSWSLATPAGSATTLTGATTVSPTFAPDIDGVYTATLIVNDGTDSSAPDSAVIAALLVVVNTPPVASAGVDRTVAVGDTVSLDGSGSSDPDGDPMTFSWTFTSLPMGSAAVLSNPAAANPNFVADLQGNYIAQLVVNDGEFDSPADTVVITAQAVVVNTAPVANAGLDQNANVGDVVVLGGSGSTDAEGDSLSFSWSLTSVPAGSGAVLSGSTAVNPSFVADLEGNYVAQLIVNDGEFDSAPDSVTVVAQIVLVNIPPVANAGLDQSLLIGDIASLDGSGSGDADGDPLTFSWSLSIPAGSGAILSDPAAINPTFMADIAGDYVAQLIVNDGMDDSSPDSVIIVAAPPMVNQPPVANAGTDRSIVTGDIVTLDGAGSSDPEDDALAYSWSITIVPVGSMAELSDAQAMTPTFVADIDGVYVVQLIVSDGEFDSVPDTVMITAQAAATGGELLYNQNCGFCHGDPFVGPAADATLAGLRRVTGARVCSIEASIFGNNAGKPGDVRFPDGVPEMIFLQGLSFDQMQDMAVFLNSRTVSGERRYVTNCAGCHGDDGSGGFTGEDVRGEGHETWEAIVDEKSMQYLGCLTGSDVDQIAAFLDHPVANSPPTANAGGPYGATVGSLVTFDGSASADLDGSIVAYNWDFGDGNSGSGESAVHSYSSAGTFTVTLTVTDSGGLFDTATTTASIAIAPLLPIADPNGPYSGFENEAVTFDGSRSSDPDGGAIRSWDWDFGDGGTGTGESPTHIYVAAGTYVVELTVTDDEGQVSAIAMTTATIEARVSNQPPIADANGPYSGFSAEPIMFDSSGSGDAEDANAALTFNWDFGDGSTGTGQNPSHSYAVAGTYTVTLTVVDTNGQSDGASTTVTIVDRPTDPDGEMLYNAWCLGCHGDFEQPNQASTIKVLGVRSCSVNASIDGNTAAGSDTPYPAGVPDMQFMQGMFSGADVDAISTWMNRAAVSGEERYATACASCHGADGSGGFAGEDIRGEGNDLVKAIADEESMQFLSCLPASDVNEIADFLGREIEDTDDNSSGGTGTSGPVFLLLLSSVALLMRRQRLRRLDSSRKSTLMSARMVR